MLRKTKQWFRALNYINWNEENKYFYKLENENVKNGKL